MFGQQAGPSAGGVPIVQPGAPGHSGKSLSPDTVRTPYRAPTEADVSFMQGMIMHHAQAVEMVALLKTRGRGKELQELGQRMRISQTDEMNYMKQWLRDRGKPESMPMDHSHMDRSMAGMKGMDHMNMGAMPLMPGMLSPEQMQTLAKSTGKTFDHLFLTGMIQHHGGALIMVDELFNTPGAGQDGILFDFATDIDNTQRAEIGIMQGMLSKEKR